MREGKRSVYRPLDDFTFGNAFTNVGELEGVENFAGCEEGVSGVEVCAEERATEEGALDSKGHLHRDREQQDPIGRNEFIGTKSKVSRSSIITL